MPLILEIEQAHFHLKVWKIEETLSFFEQNTLLYDSEQKRYKKLSKPTRKLQWIAGSFLVKQMTNKQEIIKNIFGKPFLKSRSAYISISHCTNLVVCMVSKSCNVGVDIEALSKRVLALCPKFLNEKEINFLEKPNEVQLATICWAMKEAAFKWHGQEYISFKKNIHISPFKYQKLHSGVNLKVITAHKTDHLKAFHLSLEDYSIVFCFAKTDLQKLDLL